jgi:hypothetical protein
MANIRRLLHQWSSVEHDVYLKRVKVSPYNSLVSPYTILTFKIIKIIKIINKEIMDNGYFHFHFYF